MNIFMQKKAGATIIYFGILPLMKRNLNSDVEKFKK